MNAPFHIVAAVEVNESGDATMFRPLAKTTAGNLDVDEFSGDKAHSRYANLEYADQLGATPYIPFKINSTAGKGPGIWDRMFAHLTVKRDGFLLGQDGWCLASIDPAEYEAVFGVPYGALGTVVRRMISVLSI